MLLAQEAGTIFFIDEFTERGYRTWVCTSIEQAMLDVAGRSFLKLKVVVHDNFIDIRLVEPVDVGQRFVDVRDQ